MSRQLKEQPGRTGPAHRWPTVPVDDEGRHLFVCLKCGMRVHVARGRRPTRDIAKAVNGQRWRAHDRLPPCAALKGAKASNEHPDQGHIASAEWRGTWRAVTEHCGEAWTREQLGLVGGRLDEEQEIELMRLYAAVRVRLLDADDALEAVVERERERGRELVAELADEIGGEQFGMYEGVRRVPAAGGAA